MKKNYNEPFVQYCEVCASAIVLLGSAPDPTGTNTPAPGDSFGGGSGAPRRL